MQMAKKEEEKKKPKNLMGMFAKALTDGSMIKARKEGNHSTLN